MDVNAENFERLEPVVRDAVAEADFIALDLEFTGLGTDSVEQKKLKWDTVDQRYTKLATTIRDFGMLQIGVSCFQYNRAGEQYSTATFTFPVLKKRTFNSLPYTVCQNSMRFMAGQNLDFNHIYKNGLSFVTVSELLFYRKSLHNQVKERTGASEEWFTQNPLDKTGALLTKIKTYIPKTRKVLESLPTDVKNGLYPEDAEFLKGTFLDDLCSLPLDRLTTPVIYKMPKYVSATFAAPDEDWNELEGIRKFLLKEFPYIDVKRSRKELTVRVFANRTARNVFVVHDVLREFNNTVGFTRVLYQILSRDVPLVGHNVVLDILHLMDKCVQPLPSALSDARMTYATNVRTLYDTKVIAETYLRGETNAIPYTSLSEVYNHVVGSAHAPHCTTTPGCRSYNVGGVTALHDAGYDAYITGVAFAALLNLVFKGSYDWENPIPFLSLKHKMNLGGIFGSGILDFTKVKQDPLPKILKVSFDNKMDGDRVKTFFVAHKMVNASPVEFYVCGKSEDSPVSEYDRKQVLVKLRDVANLKVVWYKAPAEVKSDPAFAPVDALQLYTHEVSDHSNVDMDEETETSAVEFPPVRRLSNFAHTEDLGEVVARKSVTLGKETNSPNGDLSRSFNGSFSLNEHSKKRVLSESKSEADYSASADEASPIGEVQQNVNLANGTKKKSNKHKKNRNK